MRKIGLVLLCIFLLINGCAVQQGQTDERQQHLRQALERQQERRAVLYWSQQVQPMIVADAKLIEWWINFRERYSDNVTTEDVQEQIEAELDLFIDSYKALHDAVVALDYPDPCKTARQMLLNYLERQKPKAESLRLYHQTKDEKQLIETKVRIAEVSLLREQFIAEYTKLVEEWGSSK